ncbi:phospholipase D-like domain-containing protein [Lactobacillus delbrueckii subsp. lactis]|uniref:phospholipase D-like domain-containing protein n=1 Tax=Lactobacillus delbrueckii TaxID=1584 RepID=UPI0005A2EE61|nr:phospholipase D-like domain-containing protein [Lactobacillus delbrueckii]MBO3082695.1 phospholipase [Lactobacillus delbrueckii subsp. bulgaricus]MCD5439005.1 phospholipase D-like domain-containing protein [Lactobacillus delbrueckii subsp. lactis]MCD5468149.1 phospholipase D-like domain-containing protein [Lactobacillus delbrueckii subsp. lactis]MCZ0796110.1 phospholipase D-like domain-containing protein [Lactobacillus delbrueckii subsp. lactis]MDG5848828.1 phospholipase D-like domain-conta
MSGGDLKREILLNTIRADAANGTDNAADILRRQYPELSADESDKISETIRAAMNTETADKVSLVVTAPPSFRIDAKPTMTVVRSMLEGAGRNILITGYSLSSYFSELTDTIIDKSQRGVFVKFFINNIEKQPDVDKLLRYKGRFLQIYDYSNEEDKMAALHAKVISVDMKQTLITSANLSYHGQQGNIELGALVESEHTAKQLDDVMTQLIFNKIFKQV